MKAAVPVAAIRQTWKCSGSVTVAQLYHCGTFVSVFQTHTQRGGADRSESRTAELSDTSFAFWCLGGIVRVYSSSPQTGQCFR